MSQLSVHGEVGRGALSGVFFQNRLVVWADQLLSRVESLLSYVVTHPVLPFTCDILDTFSP